MVSGGRASSCSSDCWYCWRCCPAGVEVEDGEKDQGGGRKSSESIGVVALRRDTETGRLRYAFSDLCLCLRRAGLRKAARRCGMAVPGCVDGGPGWRGAAPVVEQTI